MPYITLTEEQVRLLQETADSVEVRAPDGHVLTFMKPLDPALVETILECKRRLATPGPRIPSSQVKAMLRRFEEIDQSEGMTHEKMEEVLRRVLAGEPL
jgi:hypothetical protein